MSNHAGAYVLWAKFKGDRYQPTFVGAFSASLREAYPESFHEQQRSAMRWMADFGDDEVECFFTTFERIPRPPALPEEDIWAEDVIRQCAICGWQLECSDGCHS